jgi:allantoin racemase
MKVLYWIPGPMSKGRLGPQELVRRQSILQKHAGPQTEVLVRDAESGPASIESLYEEYLSIPGTMHAVIEAERDGIDAVILGCFGDPGIDGARELATIPIIGPCEASLHMAAMLGYRSSIITVLDSVEPIVNKVLHHTGLGSRFASVRVIQTSVLDIAGQRDVIFKRLCDAGKRAIEEDRADTLILGCMSLAFQELSRELGEALGVPVISPAEAALKVAESLVSLGLSHSKKAYATPIKLRQLASA